MQRKYVQYIININVYVKHTERTPVSVVALCLTAFPRQVVVCLLCAVLDQDLVGNI